MPEERRGCANAASAGLRRREGMAMDIPAAPVPEAVSQLPLHELLTGEPLGLERVVRLTLVLQAAAQHFRDALVRLERPQKA